MGMRPILDSFWIDIRMFHFAIHSFLPGERLYLLSPIIKVTSHYNLELPTHTLSAHPLWHRFESVVIKAKLIFQRVWGEDGQALGDESIVDVHITVRVGVTQTHRHEVALQERRELKQDGWIPCHERSVSNGKSTCLQASVAQLQVEICRGSF